MPKRSAETYTGQRGKEKRELFNRFRYRIIEDVYRKRFFSLFQNRCFKCGHPERQQQEIGSPPVLCIDHHVPMALGGHLVPGNLVSLCRDCNNRKLDTPPTAFYLPEELERLVPLLEAQHRLFEFSLDWDRWKIDREAYLLDLGAEPEAISAALFNEEDRRYVGQGWSREDSDSMSAAFVIRLDVAGLLKGLEKPVLNESDKPDGYGK